jgi:hypothetical protein
VSGFSDRVGFIRSVADLLHGPRTPARFDRVILPLSVLRRVALAACLVAGVAALAATTLLATAAPARAAVWVIPATARALPGTPPGKAKTLALDAAGGEYEGAQVVVRGASARDVQLSWAAGSDALITDNATLSQVAFVHITHPSTDTHAAPGYYPDPLLPRAFGETVRMPAKTAALYVLVHVPYGTKAGAYAGTLHVQNGAEAADLGVRLRVWDFGWKRLSTHTAFSLSTNAIKESLRGSRGFSAKTKEHLLTAYSTMLLQHGVTPMPPPATPRLSGDSIDETQYAADLAPWAGADGLAFPDVQIPWYSWFPESLTPSLAATSWMRSYLTGVCRVFADNGWQEKAFAYVVDEPTSVAGERAAEAYAKVLHRASAAAGFRCRFLLTDDPRPTSLGGIKGANSFLFDDVDIWCTRYYYFFGRVPALLERRAAGKEIWWYTYANAGADRVPGYLIDKPLSDQRVFGWLMQEWNVDGLLNWGTNRWGNAYTGNGWRDPYQDPVSYRKTDGRVANGDTCLIYPGYYPKYGLTDSLAGPVSSLRLEALRDGLEDREYLRVAARTSGGAALASKVAAQIAWYPYPVRQANVFDFPKYTTEAGAFDTARRRLAEIIEQGR